MEWILLATIFGCFVGLYLMIAEKVNWAPKPSADKVILEQWWFWGVPFLLSGWFRFCTYPISLNLETHGSEIITEVLCVIAISAALLLLKTLHLRLYALLELPVGVIIVGNAPERPERSSPPGLAGRPVGRGSSLYLFVRAIENYQKDAKAREDGTWAEMKRARWAKIKPIPGRVAN